MQLDPPLGGSSRGLLEVARELEASGLVRFVDVNDNATARAGISALMVSGAIERATGLETIPHLTTRDSTVLGIESQLLGAHADGVRNVLAITGDPPEVGDYPGSQGVYEIDSIGLTGLMTRLNRGEDFNGRPIDAPTAFFPGVAVNPTADDLELEAERFRRSSRPGARFAMTQIVFDLDVIDRFGELLGGWPVPVIAGIFPLTSYRLALRLHNEVPGIIVPERSRRSSTRRAPVPRRSGWRMRSACSTRRASAAPACTSSPRTGSRRRCSSCLPSRPRLNLRFEADELLLDAQDVVWRSDPVEPAQHLRLPHLAADLRLPGTWSATAPTTQQSASPQIAPIASPASESSSPERRQQPQAVADHAGEEPRGDLRQRDADDGSDEPDERRVARVLAGGAGSAARSERRARRRRRARRARTQF